MAQTPMSVVYMDPHLSRTSWGLYHHVPPTLKPLYSFLLELDLNVFVCVNMSGLHGWFGLRRWSPSSASQEVVGLPNKKVFRQISSVGGKELWIFGSLDGRVPFRDVQ